MTRHQITTGLVNHDHHETVLVDGVSIGTVAPSQLADLDAQWAYYHGFTRRGFAATRQEAIDALVAEHLSYSDLDSN